MQLCGVRHQPKHLRSVSINHPHLQAVNYVCLCRSEPTGGDGERPDAAGSKWSGQSLQPDQSTAISTDGCPGGTQRPGHHLRLAPLAHAQAAKRQSTATKYLLQLSSKAQTPATHAVWRTTLVQDQHVSALGLHPSLCKAPNKEHLSKMNEQLIYIEKNEGKLLCTSIWKGRFSVLLLMFK